MNLSESLKILGLYACHSHFRGRKHQKYALSQNNLSTFCCAILQANPYQIATNTRRAAGFNHNNQGHS